MKKNRLAEVSGKTIRRQYFNLSIYFILFFDLEFSLFWVSLHRDMSRETLSSLSDLWVASFVLIIPLIGLSIFNRFFFGRIVCVADEEGLHTAEGFFPWDCIASMSYAPSVPSKHGPMIPNGINLYTVRTKNHRYGQGEVFIPQVPVYAMTVIRRHKPDVKIRMSTDGWFVFGGMAVITAVLMICGYVGVF